MKFNIPQLMSAKLLLLCAMSAPGIYAANAVNTNSDAREPWQDHQVFGINKLPLVPFSQALFSQVRGKQQNIAALARTVLTGTSIATHFGQNEIIELLSQHYSLQGLLRELPG